MQTGIHRMGAGGADAGERDNPFANGRMQIQIHDLTSLCPKDFTYTPEGTLMIKVKNIL